MKKILVYIGVAYTVVLLSFLGYWLYYNARYYIYSYEGHLIVFDKWTDTRTLPAIK